MFDAGLCLGHSVRTPEQACRLACGEPMICTSLVESRLLGGSESLFTHFMRRFRRQLRRRARWLMAGILEDRLDEQHRYGETVFLLEPNVKRSPGTLARHPVDPLDRIRPLWDGRSPANCKPAECWPRRTFARYGGPASSCCGCGTNCTSTPSSRPTCSIGPTNSASPSCAAIAPKAGLLPVEQFMRDYFRHTAAVSHVATRFVAKAQSRDRTARLVTVLFGHRVEDGVHVGPAGIVATRRGLQLLRGDLTAIMRLVDLANLYDKPIAAATWESIRARRLPDCRVRLPPPEACRHFLSLLGHPARLGPLLRDLHDAHILERFIPEFHHARGLLQFNQYHKYTVDEHCLRAVEFATRLLVRHGTAGPGLPPLDPKALAPLGAVDPRPRQGTPGRPSRSGRADRRRRRAAAGRCPPTKPRPCDSSSTSTC